MDELAEVIEALNRGDYDDFTNEIHDTTPVFEQWADDIVKEDE